MSAHAYPPLPWRCGVCGAPGATAARLPEKHLALLCPRCRRAFDLQARALDDLRAVTLPALLPTVGRWAARWQSAGLDLDQLLDVAAHAARTGAASMGEPGRTVGRAMLGELARLHGPESAN